MSRRELFRTESIPIFQNKMFATEAAALACPRGDVVLVQDMDTGLVFNEAYDAAVLDYDSDYQNEQACSGVFQRHIGAVLEIVHRHFHGKSIVEIGCGKGSFLDLLLERGYDATGFDPAYEGENPRIVKALFEPGSGISADGVVLRHVLEHIRNPLAFLSLIADANGGQGVIYIEVPCFDWICHHRAWFDVFYEHVNYFRVSDFDRMFGTVHESGRVFNGQYLYAVADLSTLRTPSLDAQDAVRFPSDFTASIERIRSISTSGTRKAIWGGAAKGMMFAFSMKREGTALDLAIDINPAKQGKYLSGTGLRVSSPKEAMDILRPGDDVYVMNANYLQEIIAQSDNKYHYLTPDECGSG
jgi:hypothetical protein